jgi:hypothetical protein
MSLNNGVREGGEASVKGWNRVRNDPIEDHQTPTLFRSSFLILENGVAVALAARSACRLSDY